MSATDFTLVIPTYRRPTSLACLLRFLGSEAVAFPVVVLDSSPPDEAAGNREIVESMAFDVEYCSYDPSTPPFEKFRDGVAKVRTAYAGLCADDDVVIPDGIEQCTAHLRRHSDVGVANGYSFTFVDHGAGGMDLRSIVYYIPTIDDYDPIVRLRVLFRNYQALTYGAYRTDLLRHVLDASRTMQSLLAQELLTGALSVVRGTVARLPLISSGRSLGASNTYRHWHPLEWMIAEPEGLLAEYARYRAILLQELIARPEERRSADTLRRLLDLIHLFYFFRHTPPAAYDFILDRALSGSGLEEFWPAAEIQDSLIEAARFLPDTHRPPGRLREVGGRTLRSLVRHGLRLAGAAHDLPVTNVTTPVRCYRLHRAFLRPEPAELVHITPANVTRLLATMDHYETPA